MTAGCQKLLMTKHQTGPHVTCEGRISTQNADLTSHQQTRRTRSLTNVKVTFLQNADLRVAFQLQNTCMWALRFNTNASLRAPRFKAKVRSASNARLVFLL